MITSRPLRVGTRGSLLARVQTDWVMAQMKKKYPGLQFEVMTFKTTGDAIIDRSLSLIGGKGLFTEELELAILNKDIDLAVHSLKDLPTELSAGLVLGAIPVREDSRDALVGVTINELKNPRRPLKIGTSSLRRTAQLRRLFPKIEIVNIRGNVDTRIRKVREGLVDGAVLALAGVTRLGFQGEMTYLFDHDELLPAPGQGALGVEIRENDESLRDLLGAIHCTATEQCVTAERTVLNLLEGGCQVPVGAYAAITHNVLHLNGNIISLDGKRYIESIASGLPANAVDIGRQVANDLIEKGAWEIIQAIKNKQE
ncbi:MAG: hydroxymethylbilane synthase [Phycisphaerae bacterium]